MTTLKELTVEQLNNQFLAVMTTIKSYEDKLSNDTIDILYNEANEINKEIDSRKVKSTTDSMFS